MKQNMPGSRTLAIGAGVLIGLGIGMIYKVLTDKPCVQTIPPASREQMPEGPVVQTPELLEV